MWQRSNSNRIIVVTVWSLPHLLITITDSFPLSTLFQPVGNNFFIDISLFSLVSVMINADQVSN